MKTTQVSASDVLFSIAAPSEHSFRNKVVGLISLFGVGIPITVLPLVITITTLAGVKFDDFRLPQLFVLTFLVIGVGKIINDIIDEERDKKKYPLRPLATGLISKPEAVLFAAVLSGIWILIAIVSFNWLFLILVLLGLVLNVAYSRYLRDNVGYLTVFLQQMLVPVAIWSAFFPVLTPLPWLLALFMIVYTPVVQITHEALDPTIPALFVRPRPATERALYVASVISVFFVGIAILLYTQLSWLFVIILAAFAAVLLTQARNLGDNRTREKLQTAFKITILGRCIFWLSLAAFAWIK
jgi:geranylgeranylglycerol-phosphate geranylgeranyltransferase